MRVSPQGPGSPQHAAGVVGELAVEEIAERLTQTEQLVSQLKEMIREKDATLRTKDEQLKVRIHSSKFLHCRKAISPPCGLFYFGV